MNFRTISVPRVDVGSVVRCECTGCGLRYVWKHTRGRLRAVSEADGVGQLMASEPLIARRGVRKIEPHPLVFAGAVGIRTGRAGSTGHPPVQIIVAIVLIEDADLLARA